MSITLSQIYYVVGKTISTFLEETGKKIVILWDKTSDKVEVVKKPIIFIIFLLAMFLVTISSGLVLRISFLIVVFTTMLMLFVKEK